MGAWTESVSGFDWVRDESKVDAPILIQGTRYTQPLITEIRIITAGPC